MPRRWSTVPIGRKPVTVFAEVPRIECRDCRRSRWRRCPSPMPGVVHRSFERLALELRESMTLQDVARYSGVSDWLVKDIEKRWLGKHFAKPRLKDLSTSPLTRCTKKAKTTIAMDLESGAVVFVGDGAELKPFCRSLKLARPVEGRHRHVPRLRTVCDNLPDAGSVRLVPHRQALNEKLSELRAVVPRSDRPIAQRSSQGHAPAAAQTPENLDEPATNSTLAEALELNESLPRLLPQEDLRMCGRNRRSQRRSGSR